MPVRQLQKGRIIAMALLASLFLLFLISLLSNLQLNLAIHKHTNRSNTAPIPAPRSSPPTPSLFIGVFTIPGSAARRQLLRTLYALQRLPPSSFRINVVFVLCNITSPTDRVLLSLEALHHHDILFLDCPEHMNRGKTHTFFSTLPSLLPRGYDYVMKADDDAFVRLAPLAAALRGMPRRDLYYGFSLPPCTRQDAGAYMSGMGYVLSWDLVEWIAGSDVPLTRLVGPEDKMLGEWLNVGKKGKNRVSGKPAMYDYPGTNGKCSHEVVPDTVLVHRLKKDSAWLDVIQFFNLTRGVDLTPPKLFSDFGQDGGETCGGFGPHAVG